MLKTIGLAIIVLLVASSGAHAEDFVRVSENIGFRSPQFWVNIPDAGHIETNSFPWREFTLYGWSLEVRIPRGTKGTWHAVYKYPAPSEYLLNHPPEDAEVSSDLSQVTEKPKPFSANDGTLQGLCLLMRGEPPGKYKITVFVSITPDNNQNTASSNNLYKADQNVAVHSFTYEILEEKKAKN